MPSLPQTGTRKPSGELAWPADQGRTAPAGAGQLDSRLRLPEEAPEAMSAAASPHWLGPVSTALGRACFLDPGLEARYRELMAGEDVRSAQLCFGAVGLAVLAFTPTDWSLFGSRPPFWELLLLRLAYAGCCLLLLWQLRRPLGSGALGRRVRLWTALTITVVVLTNATRPPGVVAVLATHFPLLLLIYTSVPLQHAERIWLGWGYSIAFILVRFVIAGENDPINLTATVVGTLAIHVFGPLLSARAHRLGRRMAAAIWEAEDLRRTVSGAAGLSEFRYDLDSGHRLQGLALVDASVPDPADFERVLAVVHPDDRGRVKAAYSAACERGAELAVEFRLGERWMRAVGVVVGRTQVRRGHLAGLTWDIHERRSAELAAEQARARLDGVLRRGRMQLWEWDPASGRRLPLGDPCALASEVHGCDRADDEARLRAALAERREYVNEYRVLDAQGQIGWVHARGQPVLDSSGVVIGMTGFGMDITARKHVELLLRRNQRWRDIAVSSAALNLWEINPATGERRGGQLDVAMFGYSPTSSEEFDRLLHPDDFAEFDRKRRACFLDAAPFQAEYRVLRSDGEWRWLSGNGQVALDEDDGRMRIYGVTTDITPRKQAELELRSALDAARRASAAKSAFLATISHELRTPLNAVIGFAGLLLDSQLDDTQRFHARLLRSSSQQLLALINNVLDFSRIEAGEVPIEQVGFQPEECIESCLDLVSAQAEAKGLTLTLVAHGPARRAVLGDVTRVRQVAINLLTNAIKFTDRGSVHCELHLRDQDGIAWLGLRVTDTGIGISEEVRAKLFQAFQQGDASTTRRFGGTGLGLSISLRLVRLMGGEIEASGKPGIGSEFVVTLPLRWQGMSSPEEPLAPMRVAVCLRNEALATALLSQLADFGVYREICDAAFATARLAPELCEFDVLAVEPALLRLLEQVREWPRARGGEPLPLWVMQPLQEAPLAGIGPHGERRIGVPRVLRPSALRVALLALRSNSSAAVPELSQPDALTRPSRLLPRVLIAEDNSINRLLLTLQLESLGFSVDAVASGAEAVVALAAGDFGIVLMDIEMPEMDGMQATRQIRAASPGCRRPWIIAVTAHVLAGSREHFLTAGMDDVVNKPVMIEALRSALERACGELEG